MIVPVFVIIIAVVILIIVWVVVTYNSLVSWRIKVETQWSQIDVQLKMRADLIPNIVEAVSAYASHEKELFGRIAESRERLMGAASPGEEIAADSQLRAPLKNLFAIAENYPELKADAQFLELQKQLEATEKRIADFRQFYNDTTMLYNRKLELFPSNIIAALFNFRPKEYYAMTKPV